MGKSWTLLAQTAAAGTNTIVLQDAVTWQPGDQIAIASTGTRHTQDENEMATIASVSGDGRTLTLEVLTSHIVRNSEKSKYNGSSMVQQPRPCHPFKI